MNVFIFSSFPENFFTVIEQESGWALGKNQDGNVALSSFHGKDSQQWVWVNEDKTVLLNKADNTKLVLGAIHEPRRVIEN